MPAARSLGSDWLILGRQVLPTFKVASLWGLIHLPGQDPSFQTCDP